MKKSLFGVGCLMIGCSGGVEGNDTALTFGQSEDAIIRSTSTGGRNEAVMLYAKYIGNDGYLYTRTCSGSYFAPRVVLTAAHCVEGVWANQLFVYYGDNYTQDVSQLKVSGDTLIPPAPGQPSNWSQADSFEVNPAWNPELVSADMAVVYLDRKLPFDPLPLARFSIDNTWVGKQANFSGWGADTVTGPTTATGSKVQRTGKTAILGKPTAADYHADDPNPGMLDAAVRNTVVKTDGRAPYSSGCFGDSGGPLFVNKYGQDYIAGVAYWTGLYCTDYNLYTRIDPFLPFLDQAYKKGGQETLIPKLECVAPNANGSYTAYFGYDNRNGVGVTVPYGAKNSLALDTKNWRPSHFVPGAHSFAFGVPFASNQTLKYSLSPDNSPKTDLTVTRKSSACGAAQADSVECGSACVAQMSSGCAVDYSFTDCMASCSDTLSFFKEVFPDCLSLYRELDACTARTATGAANWECIDESLPFSTQCGEESAELYACLGF